MKKEVKTYEIQCDCCSKPLSVDRTMYVNDGSYQSAYVKCGEIDLCFHCAAVIFDVNLSTKVPEDKMKEWIKDAKQRLKYDLGLNLGLAEVLNNICVIKDGGPPYPTNTFDKTTGITETLQTTGINEMVPVVCLEDALIRDKLVGDKLTKPIKTTNSISTLEDL